MELAISLNALIERTDEYNYLRGGRNLNSMQMLKEAGFDVLDWNAGDYARPNTEPYSTDLVCDDWQFYIEAMRDKAEQLEMKFNQCHGLMYNYFEKDEKTGFLHNVEERVMDVCAILGIPYCLSPGCPGRVQRKSGCRYM